MKTLIPILLLTIGLTACKEADTTPALSEEDAQIIQLTVAEALADQNDGLMTELYDMRSNLRFGASVSNSTQFERPPRRPGQGEPRNETRTYDPVTGKHVIQFERSHTSPGMAKTQSVYLEYIFKNPDGAFVQFPGRQEVASIAFTGQRTGTITTRNHASETSRTATWTLTGLEAASSTIRLDGTQSNSGSRTTTLPNGAPVAREFDMTLTFAGVSIDKSFATDSTLENKVSGTITFEHTMSHTTPTGEVRERTHSGSIELAGNGRAILRIMGIRQLYLINLATGEIGS